MKRRTFILGSTALVTTSGLKPGWAVELRKSPLKTTLNLGLSDDATQILIQEVSADGSLPYSTLQLDSGQFGARATFKLGRPFRTDSVQHVIYIKDAAIGNAEGIEGQLTLLWQDRLNSWTVSLQCDIQQQSLRFAPVDFRTFARGGDFLRTTVSAQMMAAFLTSVSDGRLNVKGKGDWCITVESTFTWRLHGIDRDRALLAAFSDRWKSAAPLEMRWLATAAPEPGAELTQDIRHTSKHLIQVIDTTSIDVELRDAQGRQISISSAPATVRVTLSVIHPVNTLEEEPASSIAVLEIPRASVSASVSQDEGGVSAFHVREVLILERARSSSEARLVVCADVDETRPVECDTAAGTLMLASLQPVSVAANSNQPRNDRQRYAQLISGALIGAPAPRPAEPGTADARFSRYLALLEGTRPYADPASVYVDAQQDSRAKTVFFSSVVISAALHGMDIALPGSEWSRLRFGTVPLQMRRRGEGADPYQTRLVDATLGTAVEIVHPMPSALRRDTTVLVGLFPEPSDIKARISLERARLDVASSQGLIDLSLGFRGLSLILGLGAEAPHLRPDNSACQVLRLTDGSVVDSRPIVIMDLPPQHVLEEAWFRPARIPDARKRLTEVIVRVKCQMGQWHKALEPATGLALALQCEDMADAAEPLYALWREFFRSSTLEKCAPQEYFAPNNRGHMEADELGNYDTQVERWLGKFVRNLARPSAPPNTMRSRLSGRSRLAFRVRCDEVSEDLGVLDRIPFTFADLTLSGRLEPSVTRRAEQLARPLADGRVLPTDRTSYDNISGTTVLDFQGISAGPRTVLTHMDAVRGVLARAPQAHETSLELVSRLTLSPSQRAIFLTDRQAPAIVFTDHREAQPFPVKLWSLRLLDEGRYGPHLPDLRVIGSPDYRENALRPWPAEKRDEAFGAPPYGNRAPWMLPRLPTVTTDKAEGRLPEKLRRLICAGSVEQQREAFFRSGLSANDRHQLLLLSGAYGLPVIGKRRLNADKTYGDLIEGTDQFPAEPDYRMDELEPGYAIYAPKSLDVSELGMSALGATFKHDTYFNPPLPALLSAARGAPLNLNGRPAFDGLSVARWEHSSLHGRDIRVRVAYKGYLMPTGHQATFVKLTEREILRTEDGRQRAVLVQRLYITLSRPDVRFPRMQQPCDGRGWPPSKISIEDPSAIQIMEPYSEFGGAVPVGVGLAFWPVRAVDMQPLEFSISVAGAAAQVPMLFVDNVAVGDPTVLRDLVEHYNKQYHKRVWNLGGARLTYASAKKRGDTDLITQQLNVRVTGWQEAPPPAERWVADAVTFRSTPPLEGVGEPPFFPAMDWALVSLEAVGTLAGTAAPTVRAYFDGHYVRNGFTDPGDEGTTANPLGIYLHFNGISTSLDMGNNGDRAGCLARPNAPLQGYSREQGPVGYAKPEFKLGPNTEQCKPLELPLCPLPEGGTYLSIVHLFTPKKVAPITADPAPMAMAPAPIAAAQTSIGIAQEFFAADAKLLGTITFRELFEMVDGSGLLSEILPALEQAQNFGLAAANQAQSLLKQTRERVLQPLSDLLTAFEQQWAELQRQLAQRPALGQGASAMTLAKLFPELSSTLENLRQRLDEAMAEGDVLQLPGRLSALQESASRFLQALANFARYPAETFAVAARGLLDSYLGDLRGVLVQVGAPPGLVRLLAAMRQGDSFEKSLRDLLQTEVVSILQNEFNQLFPARYRLLPWPPLTELPNLGEADKAAYHDILEVAFRVQPEPAQLTVAIGKLVDHDDPLPLARLLVESLQTGAEAAKQKIGDHPQLTAHEQADRWMSAYITRLKQMSKDLNDSVLPDKARLILARINDEQYRLTTFRENVVALQKAVQAENLPDAVNALYDLAFTLGGPERIPSLDTLSQTLVDAVQSFVQPFNSIAQPPDKVHDACVAAYQSNTWNPRPIIELDKLADPFEAIRLVLEDADIPLEKNLKEFDALFQNRRKDLADIGVNLPVLDQIAIGIKATVKLRDSILDQGAQLFCAMSGLSIAAQIPRSKEEKSTAVLAQALQLQVEANAMARAMGGLAGAIDLYLKFEGAPLLVGKPISALVGLRSPSHPQVADIVDALADFQKKSDSLSSRLLDLFNVFLAQLDHLLRQPFDQIDKALSQITDPPVPLPDGLVDRRTLDLIKEMREHLRWSNTTFKPFKLASGGLSPLDNVLDAKSEDGLSLREQVKPPQRLIPESVHLAAAQDKLQQLIQHVANRFSGLPEAVLKRLDAPASTLLSKKDSGLGAVYAALLAKRGTLIAWLHDNAGWLDPGALDTALSPPEGKDDALLVENETLQGVSDTAPVSDANSRARLLTLASRWRDGRVAPVLILEGLKSIAERLLRGDILSLIDISALRDKIEDRINELIPTQQTLAYDFNVPLKDNSPNGDRLFSPQPECSLKLAMHSSINLLAPDKYSFGTEGSIGPFNINLVHQFGIKAITLKFGGASFRMARGEKLSLDVDFQDFEIGKDLQFIQELQKQLSIGASGAYLEPLSGMPGIRVGYALDIGIVTLGTLSFSNLSVGLGADLPFGDQQALFSVTIGRRMAPFMISAAPWAGSGYLSILSTGQAIVGFEMGMEFGFGGAFSFGPLTGYGRVQAGFAIRTIEQSGRRITEISGTFFAGGTASIWIFNFSASLYVRLTMDSDNGNMRGEAVFSFSFKVGFVAFSYQVRAHYTQNKLSSNDSSKAQAGKAGASTSSYPLNPFLELAAVNQAITDETPKQDKLAPSCPAKEGVINHTKSLADDWAAYSKYFDNSLPRDIP
jgi:hypothetical protein